MSSGSSLQPARQSASSTSSAVTDGQASSHSLGSTTRNKGASATLDLIPTFLCWDSHNIQFSVNACVLVMAALAVFPLVPKNVSNNAYRLCFLGTSCSSLYSLYSSYGKPRAWNIQALLTYFWTVITAKDFLYLIYGLTFVTTHIYPTCEHHQSILSNFILSIPKLLDSFFSKLSLFFFGLILGS